MMTVKDENDLIKQAIEILELRLRNSTQKFTSSAQTINYLRLKLAALQSEVFAVMYLNSQHQLIEYKEMFYGTIDSAPVYPREIVKMSLKFNAAAVVLSHNHPSGAPEPSMSDQKITQRLQNALDLIDVRVLDHIVVGADHTVSMAERGMM